jgi:hypothetical protein
MSPFRMLRALPKGATQSTCGRHDGNALEDAGMLSGDISQVNGH